ATGDFSGDGSPDIAVADTSGNRVVLLLTHVNLMPTPTPGVPAACAALGLTHDAASDLTGIEAPLGLATGDLDNDGKLDLAVVGAAGLSIFFGNGNGTFVAGSANPMAAGTSPRSLAIADFNRDGLLDVVVADEGSNDVAIFLGRGNRQFDPGCS